MAITARAWARNCVFEHNSHLKDVRRVHPTFPSVGENIWTGYPPSYFDVLRAIKSWVDEKQDYDYNSNVCTKVCGHYTQVCALFFGNILITRLCFFLFVVKCFKDIAKNKEELLMMFYVLVCIAHLNPFILSRLCGQAATRLVVPLSCARMVSKTQTLLLRRVSFLCATMLQRK